MMLLSFIPSRKLKKMETSLTSAGGRYNTGPDYTHYFMSYSQNKDAKV